MSSSFIKNGIYLLIFLLKIAVASSSEPGDNLFTDADFTQPVQVEAIPGALLPKMDLGKLIFTPNTEKQPSAPSFWSLATHYSRYRLTDSPAVWDEEAGYGYRTDGEAVFVRWEGNETILRLDVDTEKQYDHPRRQNEPWPHLLIEHNFPPEKQIPLFGGDVVFSFDVMIRNWENRMQKADDQPSLHCVQTNAYFIIKNVNPDSPDFNDYIWFGAPVFDSRHQILEPYQALDGDPQVLGTGKLIYTMGGEAAYRSIYGGENPADGKWCHGRVNLTAEGLTALTAAQKAGIMPRTTPTDLAIVHFNFGWEVPGTFSASMEIKNLSLIKTAESVN